MPSPLVDVLAALDRILGAVDEGIATLTRASDTRDQAAAMYEVALAGSQDAEGTAVLDYARHAHRQLDEAVEAVRAAQSLLSGYRAKLHGQQAVRPPTGAPQVPEPASKVRGSLAGSGEPAHHRHRDTIRRELQRVGRTPRGAETRGAWIDADGRADPVTSGNATMWFRRTRAILAAIDPRWTRLATHCEVQAVVRAQHETQQDGTPGKARHVTLALSREPCGEGSEPPAPYTCDQMLSRIIIRLLPPGSTLTVVDPDERIWHYPKEGNGDDAGRVVGDGTA